MRSILAGLGEPGRQASWPRKSVFILVTLVAGLVVSACEKVPLLAPSLTTITLSAASTVVQANGSTEVSATLLEQSGTPVQNGTTVTFSTTLGTLEPREARTFNGTATVRFIATGQSGEAEIRAASGAAKPVDAASSSIKIKVGAAAAARVQVTASPSRVGSSGGSSTITATVSDTAGNPLSGVAVTFTADAGSLSSSVATTSSSGQASVTLTTTREATVTATAGSTGTAAAASGTVKVTVGSLPTLTLAVNTQNPVEGQIVSFTLTVTASATTDPFRSVVVDFGNGATQDLGPLTAGTTPLTQTYMADGTYVVRATGTGFNGDTTQATANVSVADRPPITLSITANPITAMTGAPVTFTITVTAPTGGVVIRGLAIRYGDGSPIQDLGAVLSASPTHAYTQAGTYTVTAGVTDNFNVIWTTSTSIVITTRPSITVIVTAPASTKAGTPLLFKVTATPPTGTFINRYEWTWGDGTATETTTGPENTHTYAVADVGMTRTIQVRVFGTEGTTGNGQTQIVVAAPTP